MNIEQIIANAPEGADHYYIRDDGCVFYYKEDIDGSRFIWSSHQKWHECHEYFWNEATPLPKPPYSAENPPPDGWVGDVKLDPNNEWERVYMDCGMIYLVREPHDGDIFRETPTPRERFIEQAQREGADFGAIYDEFLAK